MEFQKNNGNFSFGFGSTKVAGVGSIIHSRELKSEKKHMMRKLLNLTANVLTLAVILKKTKNKR